MEVNKIGKPRPPKHNEPSEQFDSLGINVQDITDIIEDRYDNADNFTITDIEDIIDSAFNSLEKQKKDKGKGKGSDDIEQNLSDFFEGTQAEDDILEEMPSLETAEKITKKALIQMFKRLAEDDGYNSQLSLKELTRDDNWEQLIRFNIVDNDIEDTPTEGVINYVGIGTDEIFESLDDHDFSIDADGNLNFTRLKKGKIEQEIEFKTSDPDEYKVIKIPGDKQNRTITVAVGAAETIESLMNNSDLYKQAIIRTLDNTGYNSFYILDSDGLGYDDSGGKAIGSEDNAAIFSLNIDGYNQGDEAWSKAEKQTMAKTLIHEVGHLAGGLGKRGTEYELTRVMESV